MSKNENSNRWFLITCDKCKAKFTIETKTFIDNHTKLKEKEGLFCPNCKKNIGLLTDIIGLLKKYQETINSLKDLTIVEIPPEDIDFDILPEKLSK